MTFDEWVATEQRSHGDDYAVIHAAEVMGYEIIPDSWVGVVHYDQGCMIELDNGEYFTHVECDEYQGDYETVQRGLWNWAKHEYGDEHAC